MKKVRTKMTFLIIVVTILGTMIVPAAALKYTIDGDLSDWGVDLTGNWSLNDTWLPNAGVEFIVENNYDPNTPSYAWNYGTTQDPRFQGVHIKGTRDKYEVYDEPVVWCPSPSIKAWVAEPYGGEIYDLEAKYLDQDKDYIYVAIVTSVPPDAMGVEAPGDLALDLDGDSTTGKWGYEYGVKLGTETGLTQWEIGYLPDWIQPYVIPENRPAIFKGYQAGGSKTGDAIGAYVQGPPCTEGPYMDIGQPTYIIELAIAKSYVGVSGPLTQGMLHHCDACGNDHISNPIPEFLAIAIPACIIIGLFYVLRRKRRRAI